MLAAEHRAAPVEAAAAAAVGRQIIPVVTAADHLPAVPVEALPVVPVEALPVVPVEALPVVPVEVLPVVPVEVLRHQVLVAEFRCPIPADALHLPVPIRVYHCREPFWCAQRLQRVRREFPFAWVVA
jgi:hypothetical protein